MKVAVRHQSPPPLTRVRWGGLRFRQLLAAAVVLAPALVALRASMATVDLAYQIRAGQLMLQTGHVLRTDPLTFTMLGRPWLDQQWGAQVVLALLYRAGGWPIIALVDAAIASVSIWLVYLACRARGAGPRPAAWLCLGGLLVAGYGFSPRPQLLAFLLFATTLAVLSVREHDRRIIWLVPILTVIWANVHGSFVLAPFLVLLSWLEDRRDGGGRTTMLVLVASTIATAIGPFGTRVWTYVVHLSTNPEVRTSIVEWQPPRPTTYTGFLFFASAVAVGAIVLRHRRGLGWPRLLGLTVLFVLGATAVRGVIWWALAAPVLLADLFPDAKPREDRPRIVNAAILMVLIVVGASSLPWLRPTFTSTANSGSATDGLLSYAPARFSSTVGNHVPSGARIFTAETWASWFELALPADRVMVDPRIEVFPSSVWQDYDAISRATPGWQAILERWHVDVLVVSADQQAALIPAAIRDPGWRLIDRDADGAVLVRSDPEPDAASAARS